MTVVRRGPSTIIHVLREDSDLAEAVLPAQRARAVDQLVADELRIPVGEWDGVVPVAPDGLGLLVLEGLLLRRVAVAGRVGSELLGEGDVLRPWQADEPAILPRLAGWRVLEPVRFALLDEPFTRLLATYPALGCRLFGRAIQRSRQLAVTLAIVHQARVDARLHMLFWHLAARWGRVRADGVALPLRLTHSVLAELVAARRPTVTSALTDLARRGLVRPVPDAWLLEGEPPGGLPGPRGDVGAVGAALQR
jgi:CRP-like cAMP-binding protein